MKWSRYGLGNRERVC